MASGVKTSIEELSKIAKEADCELLSEEYRNVTHKLHWSCLTCEHRFYKTLATIKRNGLKCPKCNPKKAWNKGKKGVSEDTRAKMQAAKENHVPWNKGEKMSDEQRVKISCSVKGISLDEFDGFYNRRSEALTYANERYASDINYRLAKILRNRLYKLVKTDKNESALDMVGCTIEELKKHLESQFVEGMSWDNWGNDGWHIDHVKPLSSFDLTDPEEVKKACHYTNLQPLWAEDNLSKSNKR